MADLIAIEGIDGAGKGTLTKALAATAEAAGRRVATLSFPRYRETRFSALIEQYLNGRFGGLKDVAAEFAALLYAGDRLESRQMLLDLIADHDLVLLDRYVESNVAYNAARLPPDQRDTLIEWVREVEYGTFELPVPRSIVLVATRPAVADDLVGRKGARTYTEATRDLHETAGDYMATVADVYAGLARSGRPCPWITVLTEDGQGGLRPPMAIADEVWADLIAQTAIN
ncbi:MAG: thymidylate kinase [Alphaproteobacteria bacterium]